jgi:hypothetical protein
MGQRRGRYRSLDLFLNFLFGEVLIQYVVKKLKRHHMVRSVLEGRVYFLNEGRASEGRLTEKRPARGDVGLGKRLSLGRNLYISLMGRCKSEQGRAFNNWKQIVDFEKKLLGYVVEIFFASVIDQ